MCIQITPQTMYFRVRNCLALTGQNTVQSRFNNVLQTWFNRCLSRQRLNRGSALNTGQLRLRLNNWPCLFR